MRPEAVAALAANAPENGMVVSAVTAWEIGTLGTTGRTGLQFLPDSRAWFDRAVSAPGILLLPLSCEAAIAAAHLPGSFHPDPADRLLVATARSEDIAIVTSDLRILAYAMQGHVRAIAC